MWPVIWCDAVVSSWHDGHKTVHFPWKLNTSSEESFSEDGVRNGVLRQLNEWFMVFIKNIQDIFVIIAHPIQNSHQARQGRVV